MKWFFKVLTQHFSKIQPAFPISFTLHNKNHATTFCYNTQTQSWEYCDASQSEKIFGDWHFATIFEKILAGDDYTTFATKIYVKKTHQAQANALLDALKSDPTWQQLHTVSPQKIQACSTTGVSWLLVAADNGQVELVQSLLESGADAHLKDDEGCTALYKATQKGHTAIVDLLLAHGADPNIQDNDGFAPLHLASESGQNDIVKLLLQHHANPNLTNTSDLTPINLAAAQDHCEILEMLMTRAHVDLNSPDKNGSTLLAHAVAHGSVQVVRSFLQKNPVSNSQLLQGCKLVLPVILGHTNMVRLLLEHQVNTKLVIPIKTILQFIKTSEAKTQLEFFLKTQLGEPLPRIITNFSALHGAIVFGHQDIVNVLLENDPSLLNEGIDCIDLALTMKQHPIIYCITEHLEKKKLTHPSEVTELEAQIQHIIHKQNLIYFRELKIIYSNCCGNNPVSSIDNLFEYFEQHQTFDPVIFLGCILKEQNRFKAIYSYLNFWSSDSSSLALERLLNESNQYLQKSNFLVPSKVVLLTTYQNEENNIRAHKFK